MVIEDMSLYFHYKYNYNHYTYTALKNFCLVPTIVDNTTGKDQVISHDLSPLIFEDILHNTSISNNKYQFKHIIHTSLYTSVASRRAVCSTSLVSISYPLRGRSTFGPVNFMEGTQRSIMNNVS